MVAAHQVPLHRMLGIEWLYYLHIPSDLPRVYCDHTHRLYTHGSIPIASYILPPPPPAKYGEQYRGHCGNLVRALCWKDRFTNIGHPGQSRLDALHDARLALCEAHNALCTPYNMHYVLNIA